MFEKDLERISGTLAQDEFIKCIYEGLTKAEACAEMRLNPGAVGIARQRDKQFDQNIRLAEGYRIDTLVDKLVTIHEDIECPIMAGVISKNIQWTATKRQRDIYGDRTDITVDHKISITAALEAANTRVLNFIEGKALEILDSETDNISVEPAKIIDKAAIIEDDPYA